MGSTTYLVCDVVVNGQSRSHFVVVSSTTVVLLEMLQGMMLQIARWLVMKAVLDFPDTCTEHHSGDEFHVLVKPSGSGREQAAGLPHVRSAEAGSGPEAERPRITSGQLWIVGKWRGS